jgi:NAD(P)H-quinone oxidoreductase subunit 5
VLAVLVMMGGFTALFGGLVMLTQSAVKTSLAWSTVAQMGFMILQCGLALFPLALLHIVAHSLYKAHAFLASGRRWIWWRRSGGPAPWPCRTVAVGKAFLIAIAIYAVVGLGLLRLHRQIPAGHRAWRDPDLRCRLPARAGSGRQSALRADPAPASIRSPPRSPTSRLQTFADWIMAGTLPATPAPGPLEWALIVLSIVSFGLVAIAQALFPLWAYHPASAGLRVHLANGLYANAVFDA